MFYFSLRKNNTGFSLAAPLGAVRAGSSAVLARIQRVRLRLSVVKCEPPEGKAGSGTWQRSCPCPSVCFPPRPKVSAAGCFPPDGIPPPRCSATAQLRRCLSLLPYRKATSRRWRSAGKRQSPRNSSCSPSSPSPASPGSWRRRESPSASATAPTTA